MNCKSSASSVIYLFLLHALNVATFSREERYVLCVCDVCVARKLVPNGIIIIDIFIKNIYYIFLHSW